MGGGIGRPVEEGKEYEVVIDAKGGKGDGIAHIEGFVVFVAGANVGERCRIRITSIKRNFAVAQKV
ncbi:MAG: TRAM domain-containing protein [Candidatus Micrarchaeota archaeon]|nr:TRAM domain-containing protein [Candidatus Micrarchaeota archaeon]